MKKIIAAPAKVYLAFALLSILGLWCATQLKISLFPNSQQPKIEIVVEYAGQSPDQFQTIYGQRLEEAVAAIKAPRLSTQDVRTTYTADHMRTVASFNWGASPDLALREVKMATEAIVTAMPQEMRRSVSIEPTGNDIFLGVAFTSDTRSVADLYALLYPMIVPQLQNQSDVQSAGLLNPEPKEISIQLNPEELASLKVSPSAIGNLVEAQLYGLNGGSIEHDGRTSMISSPARLRNVADLKDMSIPLEGGRILPLKSLAQISQIDSIQNTQLAKINGKPSLLLIVKPKPGSNLREMSARVLEKLTILARGLPKDVHYKIIMDPSEFVTRAVRSLIFEVTLGSCLASLFLFLFIGSLRNVMTAAIEIPISMLMALVLMKVFDINITLFSLSGLALAAGMNVDASVVVMENIFRRLDEYKGPRNLEKLLNLITDAVREVAAPVLYSTLASLSVFAPFLMLDGFGYAILGDLAKVVIFSHGFSAIVALILVPCVRLHMLKNGGNADHQPPLHALLLKLESLYARLLQVLFASRRRSQIFLLASTGIGIGLVLFLVPRLPQEVISKPESDWIAVSLASEGNTNIKQIDSASALYEKRIASVAKDHIEFMFTWIFDRNGAYILVRLKDKSKMDMVKQLLTDKVKDDAETSVGVGTWNMSEFSIPEPADVLLTMSGGDPEARLAAARDLQERLDQMKTWDDVTAQPSLNLNNRITIEPRLDRWSSLREQGLGSSFSETMGDLRILTQGKWLGNMLVNHMEVPIFLGSRQGSSTTINQIHGIPLVLGDRILPLGSLADVKWERSPAPLLRHNGLEVLRMEARLKDSHKPQLEHLTKRVESILDQYQRERKEKNLPPLLIQTADSDPDFHGSVKQLYVAFAASIGLIFLVLQLQFQKVMDSVIVMVAVPLGLIGSTVALYVFQSNISLNSILGMTLLNGIAVNNSILLVDAIHSRLRPGVDPIMAIIEAGTQRLRPILITSLTTIAGMTPIALGWGEGGRVLQPLGISVAGGLALSMVLTLIFVPLLQGLLLRRQPVWKESLAA